MSISIGRAHFHRAWEDPIEEVYPRLAGELGVVLMPFLLEGVAGDPALNLGDGIHPNAAGQQRVAANIVPYLEEILSGLEEEVEGD